MLVNGAAALLSVPGGTPTSLMAFTVRDGRITRIHILADPERMSALPVPEV